MGEVNTERESIYMWQQLLLQVRSQFLLDLVTPMVLEQAPGFAPEWLRLLRSLPPEERELKMHLALLSEQHESLRGWSRCWLEIRWRPKRDAGKPRRFDACCRRDFVQADDLSYLSIKGGFRCENAG